MARETSGQGVGEISGHASPGLAHVSNIADLAIVTTNNSAEIEQDWRALEAGGIESPGQSFDFLTQWIASFGIPQSAQLFVVVKDGGLPVLAFALHRTRLWGMKALAAFPGDHVGTNAPLVNLAYMRAMSPAARTALWQKVQGALDGADLAYLCCLPETLGGIDGLFADLGQSVVSDELHRAVFDSWEQCDRLQRTRSRRKHDKQQGAKLAAMGEIGFDIVEESEDLPEILDCMFRQRNDRFRELGIPDPFNDAAIRGFYAAAFTGGKTLKGRMHVLRLNGEIVATRYNLVHGNRMFCLISGMSTAPKIQPGSPGKQCLLRVMQTEFDGGYAMFDMGAGMTDEKRHWCNEHIVLRHHYLPLTLRGRIFAASHSTYQRFKNIVKSNSRTFAAFKSLRARLKGRR